MKLRIALPYAMFAVAAVSAANGVKAVDPALLAKARVSNSRMLDVIVYLTNQQGAEVADRLRPQYEPAIEQISGQLRAINQLRLPSGTLTRAQEEAFAKDLARQPLSESEIVLTMQIDGLKNQYVRQIGQELEALYADDHRKLAQRVAQFGGRFVGRIWAVNAVILKVPAHKLVSFASHPSIGVVFEDAPNGPELSTSVTSIGANAFWNVGYTGGAFDIGVLDVSAVQQNHPGFAGKRFESNIGVTDSNGHPTNCAGILCSGDATFRGVAFGLDSIASSMVNGTAVMMTNMNWMMASTIERPENVNYSITDGTVNTQDYINVDQFFDGVCDTFGVMVSKSAGNNGFGSGSPTITRPAPAYNLLACASLNDMSNTNRADDRISSYSSRGPTPGGRKKPDIAAPGENITTLSNSGGTTTGSGTSFAAPHIGGGIILLLNRGVSDPMVAKAVLINTADAMNDFDTSSTADDVFVQGSFWNRRYGWGYANFNNALLHATDWFSTTLPAPTGGGRTFKLYKGSMLNKDKATVTWNRHVGYNGAAFPTIIRNLSNLDLYCYNQADNAVLGSSLSTIDNVEQLHVNVNAAVALKVVTNGVFDPAVASERFALATEEGFSAATGPVFQVSANGTAEFAVNSTGSIVVSVKNVGDLPAFNVTVNLTTQTPLGGNNINIGTILPGATKTHTFTFTTPGVSGEYIATGTAVSSSYGETFNGIGSGSVEVGGV